MTKLTGSYFARIRAALPSLHPSERKLADMILSFPGEIASYSASELAQLASVSNATVTRFVRKLGYDNFDQARQAARATQQSGAAVFQSVNLKDNPEAALATQIAQGQLNVENSFKAISLAEIDTLADAMLCAGRVWIVGFRTAHAFAVYLGAQISQVLSDVTVLPQAGQTLAESIASVRDGDVVVVFALRRAVRPLPQICREFSRSPARTALVTDLAAQDGSDSSVVEAALSPDWRMRVQTHAPGPLFNHAAVLTLCHMFATRCLERAGNDGRKRLLGVEAIHDSLDEF